MKRRVPKLSIPFIALALVTACGDDDNPEAAAAPAAETARVATTTVPPPSTAPPTTTGVPTTAAPPTTAPPTTAPPTTEDAGPPPLHPGVLDPGTYRNKKFAVPLTVTIDQEWESIESAVSMLFYDVPPEGSDIEPGELGLLFGAADSSTHEVIELIRTTPGVTFSEPEPASIAGLDGFVVRSDGSAEDVHYMWLIDLELGGNWYTLAGFTSEVYVLDHSGSTVLVWLDATPGDWERFRGEALAVVDSIVWGSM